MSRLPILALIAALALAPAVSAQPAAPPPVAEAIAPEALRADFTDLYSRLRTAHIDLYAFTPRADLDRAFAATLKGLDEPLTRSQAEVRFQRFLALAKMGHIRIDVSRQPWEAYRAAGGKAFPLSLRVANGRVWVADAAVAGARRGDELISLEGQPMARWLVRTGATVSAETPYMRDSLLEYWFPRLLWQEIGPRDTYAVVLRRDGRRIAVTLPGVTRAEATAFAAAQPPLLNLDAPLREARVLPGGVAYLRPGPFYNAEAASEADMYDSRAFTAFIDKAFEQFLAAGATDLIIDLRGNPGGDNAFSDPMIAWFADRPFRFFSRFKVKASPEAMAANQARIDHDPVTAGEVSQIYARLYARARPGEVVDFPMPMAQPRTGGRFTGRVWLLIDRQSYSNAVNVSALVQDYRFGKVMGEATSDMATTFGAMEQFTLPRTGIVVGFPKARIVRPSGDPRPRGVTPDIPIASPIVATPDDPMLRAAIRRITTPQ
ncbi:S41 family peptidase [Caulobacter sp. NIBR1757]|uniref:S41 family peptidase n=1 Tax=Caulobacter sp. NIBR1757 TaxID=3016000 RepID=UPI0022F0C8A7|nr:S41 family peptidase [Caulobacter sp. NIBR1757]WGM37450.1 hypothetical protein AMEJIAPC_00348 [Caulobacter sp. NIBR1757]